MKKIHSKRKILEGVVTSNKMKKTIVVTVVKKVMHSKYQRQVVIRKKYKAHDENNIAKIDDRARIIECRPYSKEKRFRLLEIIQ